MVRFFPKALSFARAKYKVLAQIKGGFKKSICGDRGAVLFGDDASKIIYEMLISEAPCMIARYGTIELACIVNSLNIKKFKSYSVFKKLEKCVTETFKYICNIDGGESFWWEEFVIRGMSNNTGFFAPETQLLPHLERFCDIMLSCTKNLDICGAWQSREKYLAGYYPENLLWVDFDTFSDSHFLQLENIWTKALRGKNVLVIHPFSELIESQYHKHREKLFENPDVLPEFLSLQTVKAV